MGWALYAWPLDETLAADADFMNMLRDADLVVPPPARRSTTPSDLRVAMRAQGCTEAFWPNAHSWFYWSAEYETVPQAEIDGVQIGFGYVGAVNIFPRTSKGGVSDWDGDWSDELSMISFDRPDGAAALLVLWELARHHGPLILMVEGYVEFAIARGDVTFGDFYRATASALFDEE